MVIKSSMWHSRDDWRTSPSVRALQLAFLSRAWGWEKQELIPVSSGLQVAHGGLEFASAYRVGSVLVPHMPSRFALPLCSDRQHFCDLLRE